MSSTSPSVFIVSFGTGSGTSRNTVISSFFATIPFHSLSGFTIVDPDSCFDNVNSWYTVKVAGMYQVTTKLRVCDEEASPGDPGISYGQGADSSNVDSSRFFWSETLNSRNGNLNISSKQYAVDDKIRMFAYADGQDLACSDGSMEVQFLGV